MVGAMSFDLYMLIAACVVYAAIPIAHNVPRLRAGGAEWALGDRAKQPELAPWVGRVERAYRNFGEWLPVFAIVVIVAHVTGASSTVTAVASALYVVARVLYTIAYARGSRLRSPLWYVSSFCMIAILVEIVRHDAATP
jgi:uncharacterized MAPEG superfamily protein